MTLDTICPGTFIFCIVFLCRLIVLLGLGCELKLFCSTCDAQTVQNRFVKQIEQKFVAFCPVGKDCVQRKITVKIRGNIKTLNFNLFIIL